MSKRTLSFWCTMVLAAVLQCIPLVAQCAPYDIVLASGKLGTSAIGLFKFTIAGNVLGSESLTIGTTGSSFDTEIALYDSVGHMVATNDNMSSRNPLSQLNFGGSNALSAGNYTVVISGFNTIFRDGNIIPGSSTGGDFQLGIQSTQPVQTPSAPSYLAKDGNILPNSIKETQLASGRMIAGTVQRLDFMLNNDILGGDWLSIITKGAGFDSEIGLYDAKGKLVATNDDINPRNLLSRLSFGLDGDNGRKLLAGAYTLLVGGFNTIFNDGLKATTSSSYEGDYAIYLQSSNGISIAGTSPENSNLTVPEPSSIYLAWLGLFILLVHRKGEVFRFICAIFSLPQEKPERALS
ncbi:DVUA0089 family protein [Propionivibrio sp.]|uniref:DVUA0089 family protein n=1 Tax=Propionivibrio sp. TaxID=2212460 RepID=UPI003BF08B1A